VSLRRAPAGVRQRRRHLRALRDRYKSVGAGIELAA